MAGASPHSIDEKSARVRNLLSSYYGTPEAAPETPSSGRSGGQPPAAFRPPRSVGLDSTAFDCDRFVRQLLTGSRLQQLLQKQLEISSEIKTLDSDMQMLVYENYNKFISATDTIRTMKNSVDSMDTKMHTLQQVLGDVTDRSTAVNTKLQQRREEMEDLSSVRGLLVKLQIVFELPKRLRIAQQQGAVEIAAEKYAEVAELLKVYGHKGAFRRVKAEVQACVAELTATVRERMEVAQTEEIKDCLQLLRKLGEPVEKLQEDYLRHARQKLEAILADAEALARQQNSATESSTESSSIWGIEDAKLISLATLVVELDQRFIAELAQTVAHFMELFPETGRQRLVQVAKEVFGRYLALLKKVLHDKASLEAKVAASQAGLLQETVTEEAFESDWGTKQIAKSLATFATDVSRLQSPLPELASQDRGSEIVEKTVRHHVGECFVQLERTIMHRLSDCATSLTESGKDTAQRTELLLQEYGNVGRLITNGVASVLQGLKSYQQQSVVLRSWQDIFVDLVQGQLQHLLLSLLAGFSRLAEEQNKLQDSMAQPSKREKMATGMILILARLLNLLETQGVPRVLELLANAFPGLGASAGSDQPPAFVAGDVARQLGAGSAALLRLYVQKHAAELGSVLSQALTPASMGQGEGVEESRPVLQQFVKAVAMIDAELSHLLNQRSPLGPTRQNLRISTSGTSLDSNVARLFQSQAHKFSEPSLSQPSILRGILQGALKSFLEGIRLQTLEKTVVHQLEHDIKFLQQQLPGYLHGSEGDVVKSLLNEALAASLHRRLE